MKQRILFYMPNFAWGGAGKIIFTLLNSLDNSKFNKSLIVNFDGGELKSFIDKNVTIHPPLMNPAKKVALQLPQAIFKLSNIIQHYDTLICGLEMSTDYIGILARAILNRKTNIIVFFLNDVYEFIKEFPNRRTEMILTKKLTKYADAVIFCTRLQQKKYQDDFGIKNGITLYPPLDIDKIVELSREPVEKNYFYNDKITFVSYGRFATQKRFDIIINSFKYLKNYNCSLLLIGDGPTKNQLISLTKKHNLENTISFLSYTSNPYKYLKHSFAFLFASNYEPFGLVIAESLALGKPVISTPTAFGPLEIIKNEENGLIAKDFEPKSFAEEIKKLITNNKLYESMSRNALKSSEQFNIKKIIKQFEDITIKLQV